MEAVSFAASIIALIQLTGKLTTISYGYIGGVKRAPKDIADLMLELGSLAKELVALKDYSDKHPNSIVLQRLALNDGPLRICHDELEVLQSKLEVESGLKGVLGSLKWPIKEKDMQHHISRIERQKSLIVFALTTDTLSLSKEIGDYVKNTDLAVRDLQTAAIAQRAFHSTEKRTKVLNWVYAGDPSTKHFEITSKRQPNTGNWLLKSPEFQEQLKQSPSSHLLWGYGIPGAGKTFLSSVVIDHLEEVATIKGYGVAYIYFDYQERDCQKPHQVLGSLVRQLAGQIVDLPTDLEKLHDKLEAGGKRAKFEELYNVFLETFGSFSHVFLVFDALDECDPHSQLKDILPLLHRMGKDGASLFVTSRQYQENIQQSFRQWAKVELSAQREDIETYIQQRIDENPRASRLIEQARCQDKIISELVDCAQGMFLAVRFHIEYLCQQATAKQLLTALSKLRSASSKNGPLDSAYERCIETVCAQPENCAQLGLLALSWLVKAQRTLTVDEFRMAVSVDHHRYELDEMDLPQMATVLDICAGLVTVDGNNIRLAHYTVQEYLLRKSVVPEEADLTLATTCITYLSFKAFAQGACISYQSYQARLKEHPFLDYAARHVSYHMRSCREDLLTVAVLKFLESPGNIASAVQVFRNYDENSKIWIPFETYKSACVPLYIASYLGHVAIVRQLLQEGATLSVYDDDGQTNLHSAAYEGHVAVVQVLLENGADPQNRDKHGSTTLHRAVSGGHIAVIQLLLDRDANICDQDRLGRTVLHLAAQAGHQTVVQLLLDKGADVLARDLDQATPLLAAALGGHDLIFQLLLANGADISDRDLSGHTSLHLAAQRGHETITQNLLRRNCSVSAKDKVGCTALYHAALGGDEAVVQLLLDNGADVVARDMNQTTALLTAAWKGHDKIVKLLLANGADISDRNSAGDTVLHLAAHGGHEVVVQTLLEKGVDASALNSNGNPVIHYAILGGNEVATQLLLGGADLSIQDKNGYTALHLGAKAGDRKLVQLLLERGASITASDSSGATALHHAASGGHTAVAQLLLEKGAELLAQDKEGDTALHAGVRAEHVTMIQLFIENGADISLPNNNGSTALHGAAFKGNEVLVLLLLQKGADLTAPNGYGNTALHLAAYSGTTALVQLLFEKGADLFATNKRGATALHFAAEKGHREVVELLLEKNCDPLARNKNGDTPLNTAAMAREIEVVQLLLENMSDLSATNDAGNTVLHSAAYGGSELVVQLLLDQGADPLVKNNDGETAKQLAARTGRRNVINLLETALNGPPRDETVGWWRNITFPRPRNDRYRQ